MLKQFARKIVHALGYEMYKNPDHYQPATDTGKDCYNPLFSPWLGHGEFPSYYGMAEPYTMVSPDRVYTLYTLALQSMVLKGDWYECGVYRGGTAMVLARLLKEHDAARSDRTLRLFDTFEGLPDNTPDEDRHQKGDLSDTSMEKVSGRIGSMVDDMSMIKFYKGMIPATFEGLDSNRIALAHVDVDLHQSVKDCCEFVYPRMVRGGFIVFDDYGFPSCPGARKAVDEFFEDKREVPLVLPTGQAVVFINAPA